jgi:prepilin-type N-terminal cleavage/methylation domain-containing protein
MLKILREMHSEKGFTLIELLVVIGILALLAGVVTIGVTQFIGRGSHEAACTDMHNIQTAVAAFMVDSDGNLPPTDGDTDALVASHYLLQAPTCTYSWDEVNGVVDDQTCTGGWAGHECL